MIIRLLLPLAVFCILFCPGQSSAQESMSISQAQAVADAVTRWDGQNPGDLFKAVKKANPDMGAITSLRELNKRMSSLPTEVRQAVVSNQNRAQGMIQQKIRDIRKGYRMTPQQARAAYGYGDIGSWNLTGRDKLPTAEMDVDSTVFGSDPAVTKEVRDGLSAELLRGLTGGSSEGLDLQKDFDIVLTAEGHEGASHVYETQGGKDWAKRNMRSVTIVNPDGTQRTYELGKGGDPIFELAMAQNMAELRTAATRGGEYDLLFNANGNLRPQNEIPREVWNKYTRQLKAVDYYISRSDTATGGILEMAKHQKQEVVGKNFEPTSAVKKNLKFAARADNIARGAKIPEKLIQADPILGDSANADMLQFARQITAAKSDQAVAELVKNRFGGEPSEGQVGALSNQVAKVILRYSEVAFQSEMDRIVLEINTKEGRKTALDRLTNHFMLIAGEGGEYTDMAASAIEAIDQVRQVNDGDGIDVLRQNWNSLDKIRQMDDTAVNRAKNYLNQTELGKKILDKYGKMLEYASKPIFGTGKPYHTSPMLVVIEGAVEAVRGRQITMVQYMGSAALWCAVVDNVRTGTDAEVAVKLGETLAMNTYYGMIASSLYAGIVQGDAKALARAIMYMIVPETALPALVEAIGQTAISLGAQILFDHQLEAQYILTQFNEQGQVKQIDDLPGREKAARTLIDDLLTEGGYKLAIGMFEKAIEVMKEKKYPQLVVDEFRGMETIGQTAMVKAMESTVIRGNQLILKDDGQLAAACASIKKYNDEIAVLGKALNLEVPETQGPDWVEGFDLGRGEKAALKKLMTARGSAQDKAKNALAAGIIRVFEERYRAELELAKGKDEALALLSQLEKILEQLQVRKDGMLALEREGTYNTIMGWFTANREKQLKAMQAVLRWRDTYLFVLEARTRAEEMAKMNIGQDYAPERRPLTGPYAPVTAPTISTDMLKAGPPLPALVGPILLNTGADSNNAQKYLKDVAEIGSSVTKDLESIKGGKLEDGYDRDIYKKIYRVRFEHACWDLMFDVGNQAKGMIGTVQLWREAQRNSQREEAFTKGQGLFKEDEKLKEEFRQYYAQVMPTIAIAGAKETKLNSPVALSATVTFPAGKREPKYEIRWTIETKGNALGSGKTTSFGAGEEGSVAIRASVWVDVGGKPQEVAYATHPIQVKKEDKKDDKKDGAVVPPGVTGTDKTDSGKMDPKYVPTCSYKYSEWGECSRATKKQIRTVTGKEPEGCVEKQKPALEQACTPPPSEEDKKNAYLNCLCRCSCGWAGHIGVWYDPEGKSEPECKSSGPCFGGAGAWGCTRRHFFVGPNDCGKGCWEAAFGKDTYDPKKADELRKNENKKYKKPLTAKITPSKNPADFGDIITLQAEAGEGSGGYSYQWGGCAQDAKDAQAKVANTRDCKPCAASVTVTDQDGDSASATVTIQCNTVKVKLTKENPKENTVPVGGKATFYAEVFSGDKPFSGPTLFYVWERNPDAIFGDPKNPQYETSAGSQTRNTATFRKAGTTPVWVTVLREIDGKKVTIGESEQIPITVANPELTIKVAPEKPNIGQEVKLQVESKPAVGDDIIGFWWDIPGYWTGTGDKASFKPKDTKPVKVTVHAKTKDGGDEVGTKEVTITAQAYQVSIGEPRYLESPPQIWKCDTQLGQAQHCGMVTLKPNEFAVFRDIFLKATVAPQPESPRYKWTVDPSGSCGSPGAGSEIKLNCSNTGTYTVKLEVTNADGAKLGEASQSVSVSVSQSDLNNSKNAKDAYDKLQKAKGLVAEGKLDEGIALANESASLDPKNAEAKSLSHKWNGEKQTVNQQLDKTKKAVTQNQFEQAEKEFAVAQKLHPKYAPVVETAKLLKAKKDEYKKGVADKLNKARELAKQGKLDEAIALAEEASKLDKAGAAPVLNELSALSKKQGWDSVYNRNFKDAVKRLEDAARLNPNDQDAKSKLAQAKKFAAIWPQVEQKAKEFDQLISEKKVFSAQKKMLEMQELQREMTGGMANPLSKKATDDFNKALQGYNEFRKGVEQKYTESLKGKNWEEGQKLIQESLKRELSPADEKNDRSRLAQCQQMLGEQKQAWDFYQKTKADVDQNRIKEPSRAAQELRQKASVYGDKAPQRQQIVNLANALEKKSGEDQKRMTMAKQLRAEGEALQKQNKLQEAIGKYKESMALVPDAALAEHVRMLEGKQAEAGEKKATADKLWQEGTGLFNQGQQGEALTKFKESLRYFSDASRTKYVSDLEARRAKAAALRDAGAKLQQGNRIPEAIAKYKESQTHWPDPALTSHIATLESKLKQDADTAARKAQAKQLRDEGYALQQKNQLQAAVGKYRESLAILPDKQLEDYIRQLEAKIAAASVPASSTSAATSQIGSSGFYLVDLQPYGGKKGSARKVKNIDVDDGSWIRLKATQEKKLSLTISLPRPVAANAVAVVTNLDNAHNVPDGFTTTVLTVLTTAGERSFEFKAGIHSSEWNRSETGGAEHKWPKETYVGDKRWMAVFALPQGSTVTGMRFDHRDTDKKYYHGDAAVGFCLRGITLEGAAVSTATGTGSAPSPPAKGNVIFTNGNIGGVYNKPSRATTFTLRAPHVITLIMDYHWNNGRGATPGTIALRGSDGRTYGPWQAKGNAGQGGVPNAYWNCYPGMTLPAGTYTVIDSDPATWAQNSESGGAGHIRVEGYPAGEVR